MLTLDGLVLLGEPRPIEVEGAGRPPLVRLVERLGAGELNGEVNLLLPWEFTPYTDLVAQPGLDPELARLVVFATCNDGSALGWEPDVPEPIRLLPSRCTAFAETEPLEAGADWASLLLDGRFAPEALVAPYFVPREAFPAYTEILALSEVGDRAASHHQAAQRFEGKGWTVLRSFHGAQHTLTSVGSPGVGLATFSTLDSELVGGALDARLVVHTTQTEKAAVHSAALEVLEAAGWIFDA